MLIAILFAEKKKEKKQKTKFTKTDDELNNRIGFILLAVGGVT